MEAGGGPQPDPAGIRTAVGENEAGMQKWRAPVMAARHYNLVHK